jgi:hypothetical protein
MTYKYLGLCKNFICSKIQRDPSMMECLWRNKNSNIYISIFYYDSYSGLDIMVF